MTCTQAVITGFLTVHMVRVYLNLKLVSKSVSDPSVAADARHLNASRMRLDDGFD